MLLPLTGLLMATLVFGFMGSVLLKMDPTVSLTIHSLTIFIIGSFVGVLLFSHHYGPVDPFSLGMYLLVGSSVLGGRVLVFLISRMALKI